MNEMATAALSTNGKVTIEIELVVDGSTVQPSHAYQSLIESQFSSDEAYQDIKCPGIQREPKPTNDTASQPKSHATMLLILLHGSMYNSLLPQVMI